MVYNASLVSGSIDQDQVAALCEPHNRTLDSRATCIDVTLIVTDLINLKWRDTVNLPSRIVDISSALDNETVLDHPFMRPKIEYRSNFENAPMLLESFPGLRQEDLPDGEGWAFEIVQLTTHNGTHMDAPMHFHSKSIDGKRMMSIDEVPLEWFFRPAVKLDFRHLPDGHVVSAAEVETEFQRIGHELKPFDIVLVNTRAASCIGSEQYLTAGCGMGREATLHLTSRGVRVTGIDAWGWDAPFAHTRKRWLETRDPKIIWEGHKAGREIPYCHMEKLCNLEQLPPKGFTVACFPYKVKGGSAGWTRAVALFD
jgi:kynurenine formamidase